MKYPVYVFSLNAASVAGKSNAYRLVVHQQISAKSADNITVYNKVLSLDKSQDIAFMHELDDVSLILHPDGILEIVSLSPNLAYRFHADAFKISSQHLPTAELALFIQKGNQLDTPISCTGNITITAPQPHFLIKEKITSTHGQIHLQAGSLEINNKIRGNKGVRLDITGNLKYGPDDLVNDSQLTVNFLCNQACIAYPLQSTGHI